MHEFLCPLLPFLYMVDWCSALLYAPSVTRF